MRGVIGILLVVLGCVVAYLVLSGKLGSLSTSLAAPAAVANPVGGVAKSNDPKGSTVLPSGINAGAPRGHPVAYLGGLMA